jgi:CheY-like chemotaxis protein
MTTGSAAPCVAIIDSDMECLRLIERLVLERGYRARAFAAPVSIRDLQDIVEADLIVTALFMPQFDGFEIIRAVRAVQPTLPIIAIAENDPIGDFYLRAARTLGADGTLAKSDIATALPEKAAQLLEKSRNGLEWGS